MPFAATFAARARRKGDARVKVKAPFHGYFTWQAKWAPTVIIYAHVLYEHWFGEYEWDYYECQRIEVPTKFAVRMGNE